MPVCPAMEAYLAEVTRRLQAALGDRLLAAWVVGSSALGDFDRARSDVDVQAVAATRPARAELEALASALTAVPCPVRGLEFVLYARPELPAFALNLNTGPGMDQHEGYDPAAEPRFWFILDLAIAREHARPLAGPHPCEVVPDLPDALIRAALRESLAWWREFGGAEAVLAACRAWAWTAQRHWLAKGDA